VQVFDVGRDPKVGLFMVMELLQGEDLEMRLRKEPGRRLDPTYVAQIGYQTARALVKAHAARVIHRDLKPANVFLTERDDGSLRVKILDFGISKLLASSGEASVTSKDGLLELTAAGVALGTPQYMSPEQAQGLTTVNHRTDVWGLGVVLYEALAGVPAYPELSNYQETIMKILTERAPPLASVAPWVPPKLAAVVHDAVEHDVTKRIQDCATFAERIAEAVPEAALGATGQHVAPRKSFVDLAQPDTAPTSFEPSRPVTIGGDTQVVVRPSDPSAAFIEGEPSTTMLADSVPATRRDNGAGVASRPGAGVEEEAPLSSGDPTMFQSPAWVEAQANEGPSTMKTLAMGDAPPPRPPSATHGVVAAGFTALVVIGVGIAVLALLRTPTVVAAPPPNETALANAPAAAQIATVTAPVAAASSAERELEPAPPPTGTAAPALAVEANARPDAGF
jgi:serine/threonine protein kinase